MPEQNVNPRETGDWSVETLFAHLTALVGEVDRRYEQRFIAQEQALAAAFQAADRALQEADRRYEQRFQAQGEAIGKSEAANEKRFEGVNEFRDQLRDQASMFMPRAESEARTTDISTKIDTLERRQSENFGLIQSRLDIMVGQQHGAVTQRTEGRDSNSAVIAMVTIGITVVLAAVTIIGVILSQGSGTP